jgi:hypothetical protein
MSELALKWGKEAKEKRLTYLDLGNHIPHSKKTFLIKFNK